VFSPHCYLDILDRYNAEQKKLGKKPIEHNTPKSGDREDTSRNYRGRSYKVAMREQENAELEKELCFQMNGNYIASDYTGGRCSVTTCYVEADGTEVDYRNTPDTTPAREQQESEMEVEEGDAQAEENINTDNEHQH
jgi:hypothetical protein